MPVMGRQLSFNLKGLTLQQAGIIDSSWDFLTDEKGSTYNNLDGNVILPKPGYYKIVMWSEPDTKFPEIEITDQELFTCTYNEPRILVHSGQRNMYGHRSKYMTEIYAIQ